MSPCYIIAEIGINHNGDIGIAKDLIKLAKEKGCDAVKFQKRTIDLVYSAEELAKPRESKFGDTNGDLKRGLEFSIEQYIELYHYSSQLNIDFIASPWDLPSIEVLSQLGCKYIKIPSALATNTVFLQKCAATSLPLILSTGMMDQSMIYKSVGVLRRANADIACVMHCTSTYPAKLEELNLSGITTLINNLPSYCIGYSGHEVGVYTSVMAAVLGARMIERHITLSRAMWGSDQAASLEPEGLGRLVQQIRAWEIAQGDGRIKVYDSEKEVEKKLRKVNDL